MNKERMLKWAKFLDRVPAEKFDMGFWGLAAKPVHRTPRCATTACALGWATAIPDFASEGLELVTERGGRLAHVRYGHLSNDGACAAFFDIPPNAAWRLCFTGDDDPKQKAREIRALVAATPK